MSRGTSSPSSPFSGDGLLGGKEGQQLGHDFVVLEREDGGENSNPFLDSKFFTSSQPW